MTIAVAEELVDLVRAVAGARLDDLVRVMLDYAVPPLFLGQDNEGPVALAYALCVAPVDQHVKQLAAHRRAVLDALLPWHLQGEELTSGLVEVATWNAYFEVPPSILANADPNGSVFRAHPRLLERLDDRGLLHCDDLNAQSQALLYGGDALHYHQFLRRHFSGHVNYKLINKVLEVGRRPGNQVRLAVDERRRMPAGDFREYFEKDHWYGPPLTYVTIDDGHKLGCTAHWSPNQDGDYPAFFALWTVDKEGHKVFQAEELSNRESPVRGLRALRYLHAIRDIENGEFVHCDAAVRLYDTTSYADRANETMPTAVPATHVTGQVRRGWASRDPRMSVG